MSGLAGLLAGHVPAGIYRWRGAFDVVDVRHAVELAEHRFGHVDGLAAQTRSEFLAAVGTTLDFPDYYGQNFDALEDCLGDVGRGQAGAVLLWDGWGTLARADEKAFSIAMSVLGSRVNAERGGPFSVLLRGEGPDTVLAGIADLD